MLLEQLVCSSCPELRSRTLSVWVFSFLASDSCLTFRVKYDRVVQVFTLTGLLFTPGRHSRGNYWLDSRSQAPCGVFFFIISKYISSLCSGYYIAIYLCVRCSVIRQWTSCVLDGGKIKADNNETRLLDSSSFNYSYELLTSISSKSAKTG